MTHADRKGMTHAGKSGYCTILNLPRRTDRKQWMNATCACALEAAGVKVHIVDAVDGKALKRAPFHSNGVAWSAFPSWALPADKLAAAVSVAP